jgi:mevalonate kinase
VVLALRSDLPIASGLGSGTAVSVALARALGAYVGHELPPNVVSDLAYEVEKIHHGTPSGIDNTVVAYEQPVYFVRGKAVQVLEIGGYRSETSPNPRTETSPNIESETSPNQQPHSSFPIHHSSFLLIANTGIPSSTRETVAHVRRGWEAAPDEYEARFDRMGAIADAARACLERGDIRALGPLLDENHRLLQALGVSLPILDRLVTAAHDAGAWGAKLTGGGGGGNMIALVSPEDLDAVQDALQTTGATHVWQTPLA